MSIIFNPDTSVQLPSQNTFTSSTDKTNLNDWTKVAGSNLYNTSLANVAIGTTSVATYRLNVNGSLNFTSLYQTGTLINFANFATDSELSSGLATKQDTLTAATTLLGIGSSISALDYNKITLNKPSLFPPDLTNIYIKSEVNQLITNTSNYSLNISNALKTNIDTNNTTTNTNSSNFTSGTSNILRTLINTNLDNSSNFTTGTSNILRTLINTNLANSSNYASNISNVLLVNYNSLNTTTNTNISNYASNISNIINANFLKLSGGVMSGQITGVSTISATTGLFGQVATTNNTNVALPSLGVQGGVGDKLILFNGTASIYPYSLGINASTLWYSVPTGASHIFYVGGTNRLSLSSTMTTIATDLTINKTNNLIQFGATNGNNIAVPDTNNFFSTSALANDMVIRSINNLHLLSGSGNSAITIKATNNRVGINTNNPSQIFQVGNAGRLRISNGIDDYSLLGTIDTDGATNTRIVVSGNTRDFGFAGNIDYISTAGGSHIFYTTNSTTERMRIASNGNVGIGTNDPGTYKLNVIGAIKMSSFDIFNPDGSVSHFQFGSSGNNYIRGKLIMDRAADTASILANVAIGTTPQTEKLYVNGNTTINGVLKLKNSEWHTSIDNVNRLYFALNEITYYCCGGNSQLGHFFMNNLYAGIMYLYNNKDVMMERDLRVNQYITSKCYDSFGEDFSFVVNWNGTTSSGWFVPLNRFWSTGHTCLNVSILPLNAGGKQDICWFGRVYLSHAAGGGTGVPPATSGGVIQISTDFRNPASSSPSNYYVQVGERWDGSGNNALFIQVNNPVYAGLVRVKIRG